jgi:hypothetical protein
MWNEEVVFFLYSLRRSFCSSILGKSPMQLTSWHIEWTACARWGQAVPGAVRSHQGCGRTRPSLSRHRLNVIGSWVGLGHVHIGVWPRFGVWMGYLVILWSSYALHFAWLHTLTCISYLCPAKHIYTKTHGKCESKALILSFGIHICLFCLNVGGRIMS